VNAERAGDFILEALFVAASPQVNASAASTTTEAAAR
jgi:hypothetical protein